MVKNGPMMEIYILSKFLDYRALWPPRDKRAALMANARLAKKHAVN